MKNPFRQNKPHKINLLFQTSANLTEQTLSAMRQALIALIDQKPQELRVHVQRTIELEGEADKIYDQIVENIYSREMMVFSRADRLALANEIDDVMDMAENVVRRAGSYFPLVPSVKFGQLIKSIADDCNDLGIQIHQIIKLALTDFNTAEQISVKIRMIRRNIRKNLWEAIEELFYHTKEAQALLYYDRLIRNLRRLIDESKELADTIRNLIIKYRI